MNFKTIKIHALTIFITVIVLFTSCHAFATERNVAEICASYAAWCKLFSITNFDEEIRTEKIASRRYMYIDNIAVLYDPDTYNVFRVNYYCTSDLAMENSDAIMRLYSFIAAIEFGKPDTTAMRTDKKAEIYIARVKIHTLSIADDMMTCYNENDDFLNEGGIKLFHVSENGTYYITFSDDEGLTMLVSI